MRGGHRQSLEERFFEKVTIEAAKGGCWWWNGFRQHQTGTPLIAGDHSGKSTITGYAAAWLLFKKRQQKRARFGHTCNNKRCVNPDHLFIMAQTLEEHMAKLSPKLANEIRNDYRLGQEMKRKARERYSARGIAKRYGVTHQAVYAVIKGKVYKEEE